MAENKGGRPSFFNTPEELQSLADEYFDSRKPEILTAKNKDGEAVVATNSKGQPVVIENRPTITGLAYHLGFESRQSFYDYEQREEFSYTIKRLRLRIERDYEETLRARGTAGDIFGLKNFGWSDKQELEHSGQIRIPPVEIHFVK